jgi:hypothetical protein
MKNWPILGFPLSKNKCTMHGTWQPPSQTVEWGHHAGLMKVFSLQKPTPTLMCNILSGKTWMWSFYLHPAFSWDDKQVPPCQLIGWDVVSLTVCLNCLQTAIVLDPE